MKATLWAAFRTTIARRPLWVTVALVSAITFLHYLTPQMRLIFPPLNTFLSRHSFERILFVLPVAVATVGFRQRGGTITLACAVCAMLPRALWVSPYPADALVEVGATIVTGGLVVWAIEAQAREKEVRQQLAAQNERLYNSMRFYARQITRAQEDERQRIARDLHDETVQMLVVLSRRIEALASIPESLPREARERLKSIQELIAGTQQSLRGLIRNLRPPTLDHLGLVATVRGLSDELSKMAGIEIELQTTGEVRRLPTEIELALFRIAQEALNNVRRHSGASRAVVGLAFGPQTVRLTVEDDGRGFVVTDEGEGRVAAGQLGLAGMAERAETLGGTLSVRSTPGQGTTIAAEVPIHRHPRPMVS